MTEQPDNLPDYPQGRNARSEALLIAIGETRAAARQAADAASRTEHAVGGLATRVGKLEVDVATLSAQFRAREHADAEKTDSRTNPWTVAAVLISAAAVMVTVLLFTIKQ
jgi:hypothetical protein